ncbi:VanZ family protein [Lederbergia lenta]|uniref:VanZ family protein n=1 Tax=Lederbergia lenta TaxID=1467 RepID=UPI00203FE54B|nr:VanZ family protein [Lederbergia lenta]MCM3110968.1 VanZ family protein [Lederbergia lenta]
MDTIAIIAIIFITGIGLLIIADFIKNKTRNFLKRTLFYSFIIYLLNVAKLTLGVIHIPPFAEMARIEIQFIPFYFVMDWIAIYRQNGLDWFFWNSVKLTFYNLIMLLPLGIYLSLLFNINTVKKAVLIVFLSSFIIEISQLILSGFGIISIRTFDVDDLILNTLGGYIGYRLWISIRKVLMHMKTKFKLNDHKNSSPTS